MGGGVPFSVKSMVWEPTLQIEKESQTVLTVERQADIYITVVGRNKSEKPFSRMP